MSFPRSPTTQLVLLALSFLSLGCYPASGTEQQQHYLNEWVVKIRGGRANADRLAQDLGYDNRGQVGPFPDTYVMHKRDHPHRSRREAPHLTKRLTDDVRVEWAEQQFAKNRAKRDLFQDDRFSFDDPLWQHQWYLQDTRGPFGQSLPKLDLNAKGAWAAGFTGKGVSLTVLDDGLEWNHSDIRENYDPFASYDFNSEDADPSPAYNAQESNAHGTRCAGEIAMVANNNKCGVGVAYEAKIGGIRMLDGPVTDLLEGKALTHNLSHVDVYSASWGPTDDGRTVEGPGRMASEAFRMGVTQGRGGKGAIYVWASGNGGYDEDNCNCDGYTGSIYTLSVGSASQHGKFPWYGERCASTLACTYSSGAYMDQRISSTDLHDQCTIDHTGTSAAAPLAAGIVALGLQANPDLTWRDVQHLVVWTSEYVPLQDNEGWLENARGFRFNNRFGFGLMNAAALVAAAQNWTNVPPQATCEIPANVKSPLALTSGETTTLVIQSNNCNGTMNEVNFLEHVELLVDIEYSFRGALTVTLKSPSGTLTTLLLARHKDSSSKGFPNWRFMSVHTWGEDPRGDWTVTIMDKTKESHTGKLKAAALFLYGTRTQPGYMRTHQKRDYHDDVHLDVHGEGKNDRRRASARDTDAVVQAILDGEAPLAGPANAPLDWNDLVGKNLREARAWPRDARRRRIFGSRRTDPFRTFG